MKQDYFRLIPLFSFIILCFVAKGQSWKALGPDDSFSYPNTEYLQVKCGSNNYAYAVFRNKTTAKAGALMFNGSSWSNLGSSISESAAYTTDIALDNKNVPYVVYMDGGVSNKATVKSLNGSDWSLVGLRGFSKGTAAYTSIAIDGNNNVYVSYIDGANFDKISVKKWSGSGWLTLGTEGFSEGAVVSPELSLDNDGVPYVIYMDETLGKALVKKFDGVNWVQIGPNISSGSATNLNIVFDTNNVLYVGFTDNVMNVKKLVSGNWSQVGSLSYTAALSEKFYLGISKTNTPYVLYCGSTRGSIMEYMTPTTWNIKSEVRTTNNQKLSWGAVEFSKSNTGYFLYTDGGKDDQMCARVFDVSANTMNDIENKGLNSNTSLTYSSYTLTTSPLDGTPYITYQTNSGTLVRQFKNGKWNDVGSVLGSQVYLKVSSTGVPYAGVTDQNQTQLKRFVNSQWTNYLSAISGSISDIAITPSGALYYRNSNYLRKNVSGIWIDMNDYSSGEIAYSNPVEVGDQVYGIVYKSGYYLKNYTDGSLVSTGTSGVPQIRVDKLNNIFIFTTDNNSYSIIVKKLINGAFSNYLNYNEGLYYYSGNVFFDGDNNLNVFTLSQGFSTVKKYVSGSWVKVGDNNINAKPATYLMSSSAVNSEGDIYVMYSTTDGLYVKGYGLLSVLPLNLTSFKAVKKVAKVQIDWTTGPEISKGKFIIERSSDSRYFGLIGTVPVVSKNEPYSFNDFEPAQGLNYYRLSHIDGNGETKNLGIKSINFSLNGTNSSIYPSPVRTACFTVADNALIEGQLYDIVITDLLGKVIYNGSLQAINKEIKVDTRTKLSAGLYLIKVGGDAALKLILE